MNLGHTERHDLFPLSPACDTMDKVERVSQGSGPPDEYEYNALALVISAVSDLTI
jgi:hypothetical protein